MNVVLTVGKDGRCNDDEDRGFRSGRCELVSPECYTTSDTSSPHPILPQYFSDRPRSMRLPDSGYHSPIKIRFPLSFRKLSKCN